MIKVLQFGEGNFLRTFVDYYFDELNVEGGDYGVNIVKPITFGSLEKFVKQDNKYHVVLRGSVNGQPVEKVKKINVLQNAEDTPWDFVENLADLLDAVPVAVIGRKAILYRRSSRENFAHIEV
jgi:tagaturonate reductase